MRGRRRRPRRRSRHRFLLPPRAGGRPVASASRHGQPASSVAASIPRAERFPRAVRRRASSRRDAALSDAGPRRRRDSRPDLVRDPGRRAAEHRAGDAPASCEGGLGQRHPPRTVTRAREEQDASQATYASGFSEDETVLDLALSTYMFQCRASALILSGLQPRIILDGERRPLRAVRRLPGLSAQGPGLGQLAPTQGRRRDDRRRCGARAG